VRAVAARGLAAAGYEVLVVGGAQEALELLGARESRIDLVLSDIVMPGMDGRQLAERIAALRPDLPVLLMTGYDAQRHAGGPPNVAGPVVAKPFTVTGLQHAVDRALRTGRRRTPQGIGV
jgi:hypothetical protein